MFSERHYLPILTGKLGEFRALRDLSSDVKDSITPLLEVPPSDWDFENDVPTKTVDELIALFAENIEKHWGQAMAYVDSYPIADEGTTATGEQPLAYILNDARARGLQLIPVTGLTRDSAYQAAVSQATQMDHRGVCLRLLVSDINDTPNLASELDALLGLIHVGRDEVDLLIDFGAMEPALEHSYNAILPTMINNLPHLNDWRTLSLAGSAFPNDLSTVAKHSTQGLRRTEWHVWAHLVANASMQRRPMYSDYAIDSPEYVSLDFRIIKMSANIRYTHFDEWIVVRGGVIKKGQASQYPELARLLRAFPQYMGRTFSTADAYIDDCATGDDGPGNATTWRQVGTNHHLTFVVRQIANLP